MHRIEFKTNNYIKNLNNIYYNFEVFCVVFNQKTHRRYLNTQDTDIQTDNMCSVWMMHAAAGFCVFSVCYVYSKGFLRMAFSNWFTWHNLDQGFSTFCYSHTPKSILSPFVYSQIKIEPLCVPPSTLLLTFCMLILIYLKFRVPPANCLHIPRGTPTPGWELLI
jgi:hypothetical protein